MILAGTGHRPAKLLLGYAPSVHEELTAFARKCFEKYQPSLVITGMALGWDQALAAAAIEMSVPFDAYVPFTGQELMWPDAAQAEYRELLNEARDVKVCSEGSYRPWKMQRRNEEMVDAIDKDGVLLVLWNGSSGGTANCIAYARTMGKRFANEWQAWCDRPSPHI